MAAFPNTRALFKKREKLEALIEAAIDCLDSLDDDPEVEYSIGFDEPEFDCGENDTDVVCEDEFTRYEKALTRRQAAAIRRKVATQLASIHTRRVA